MSVPVPGQESGPAINTRSIQGLRVKHWVFTTRIEMKNIFSVQGISQREACEAES
ncbi:hypothetical protein WKI47_00215 [Saccharibacillus sacchari]|uniref:Uncharacterized protein n=1 Tax=Saccharibacillus sacchari TaxID=456493 RepID=A0ACC6P5Z8_9BACL